ncbi:hypothetical protein TNCV_2312881 [Trichonephila clavipes]|nr:hypothetical protein TNCV_2312881 [Trichonephila clavipes]
MARSYLLQYLPQAVEAESHHGYELVGGVISLVLALLPLKGHRVEGLAHKVCWSLKSWQSKQRKSSSFCDRLFRGAVGPRFIYMEDNALSPCDPGRLLPS